ncbi:N-acetylaspartate synthetase isoform X1 [Hypanus sabinus]|uniref:N-acetylaspartate synthetase isoform X1 n=1 Tax=Hypanus sabinus TaxID=79690 RepID=UPI0028C3B83F|nr:N-acetylaspartate synthetase isoform X1 [Hypanus sabinus]
MPISPPVMVCQTKIVADEEMPGSKNDPIVSSSQMWPPPAPQPPAGSSSPAAPLETTPGEPRLKRGAVYIREFELSDRDSVRRIFFDGIMERIPNTAFRGLKQQPRILLFYLCLTVMCFYLTKSLLLTCCVPILLLGSRYHYSRKVIVSYLECALQTDMSDIEQYYMKPAENLSNVAGTPDELSMDHEEDLPERIPKLGKLPGPDGMHLRVGIISWDIEIAWVTVLSILTHSGVVHKGKKTIKCSALSPFLPLLLLFPPSLSPVRFLSLPPSISCSFFLPHSLSLPHSLPSALCLSFSCTFSLSPSSY